MNSTKGMPDPAQWLTRYGDYLYSLAMLKVGHKETAEDLVQETFIAAIKAKDSFRNDSAEKTWLAAILKNKIIDHYRKNDVLKHTTTYLADTDNSFTEHFFDKVNGHWLAEAAPQQWKEQADTTVNRNEFYRILRYCLQKMPPRLIPVFAARFLEEEESDTICKEFNISSSNYWVLIHRAKVLMRSCLEKNWFLN
jgi:RNA polymerase sigma-70 factor (ECF subfamily)